MDKIYLKRWAWIFFLLPFLAGGDLTQRNAKEIQTPIRIELQEGIDPVLSLEEPLPRWLLSLTENIAFEHGLSPKLVKSIILTESNGDPLKVSPRGAKGLMQLMPVITKEYKVLDPHDPVANIRGGVQYLRSLLEEFSGDLYLALAAYNAGPGAVRRYRGIPPFPETQEFVRKVSKIFHSGEKIPPLIFPPLWSRGGEAHEKMPATLLISGTPRSLGLFMKEIEPGTLEVRDP